MTLLSSTEAVLYTVLPIIGVLVGAVIGIFVFRAYQSKKLGAAKQAANKMVEDAVNEVKEMRKTATREAKEELAKERSEQEKELREKQPIFPVRNSGFYSAKKRWTKKSSCSIKSRTIWTRNAMLSLKNTRRRTS